MNKALFALLGSMLLLSGCSLFHSTRVWNQAQSERPLEIPPDLDTPPTSAELQIPGTGDNAGTGGSVTNDAGRVSAAPVGSDAAPVSGDSLRISDTVDNAYRRVGLALQRAGVGELAAHDDAAHTYQFKLAQTKVKKAEGGFFHRLFSGDKTETVQAPVNISVTQDGDASMVRLDGEQAAVERLLGVLKKRLK